MHQINVGCLCVILHPVEIYLYVEMATSFATSFICGGPDNLDNLLKSISPKQAILFTTRWRMLQYLVALTLSRLDKTFVVSLWLTPDCFTRQRESLRQERDYYNNHIYIYSPSFQTACDSVIFQVTVNCSTVLLRNARFVSASRNWSSLVSSFRGKCEFCLEPYTLWKRCPMALLSKIGKCVAILSFLRKSFLSDESHNQEFLSRTSMRSSVRVTGLSALSVTVYLPRHGLRTR